MLLYLGARSIVKFYVRNRDLGGGGRGVFGASNVWIAQLLARVIDRRDILDAWFGSTEHREQLSVLLRFPSRSMSTAEYGMSATSAIGRRIDIIKMKKYI